MSLIKNAWPAPIFLAAIIIAVSVAAAFVFHVYEITGQ